ncbi:MAG: hypothetical protein WCW30_03240 [Candidatus Gracilibacteria bacterium]|jgi:transcription elongation factor Elf1
MALPKSYKCPICQHEKFEEGWIGGKLEFIPKNVVGFKKVFNITGVKKKEARRCLNCGNIQFFIQK